MARGFLSPYGRGSRPSGGGGGSSLFDLHRQMNRLFDDLLDVGGGGQASGGRGGSGLLATMAAPAMEVHQDENHIEITAELPGVRREDVDLSIEDGVLTISGEKKSERQTESGYSERSYGRFERRITLPSNIDEDACSADFNDGVLRITLPVAEEKNRARRIPLGEGQSGGSRQLEGSQDGSGRGKSEQGQPEQGHSSQRAGEGSGQEGSGKKSGGNEQSGKEASGKK